MNCKKCGSKNVTIQAVVTTKNKHKSAIYWIAIGWFLEPMLWIFLTIPKLIFELFKPNKIKSRVYKEAICQDCGHNWRV